VAKQHVLIFFVGSMGFASIYRDLLGFMGSAGKKTKILSKILDKKTLRFAQSFFVLSSGILGYQHRQTLDRKSPRFAIGLA